VGASEEEELAPTTQSVLFVEIPSVHGTATFPLPYGFIIVDHIDHAWLLGHGNFLETDLVFGSMSRREKAHLALRI
jgi:hypothetical protein